MKRNIVIGLCLLFVVSVVSVGICQQTKTTEPAKPAQQTTTPAGTETKKPQAPADQKAQGQEQKPWEHEERAPGKFNASEGC